jgi:hypothetical protein
MEWFISKLVNLLQNLLIISAPTLKQFKTSQQYFDKCMSTKIIIHSRSCQNFKKYILPQIHSGKRGST